MKIQSCIFFDKSLVWCFPYKLTKSKVEKDNACDKMDACEEAMKYAKVVKLSPVPSSKKGKKNLLDAQVRAQKGEDEVAELDAKALYKNIILRWYII